MPVSPALNNKCQGTFVKGNVPEEGNTFLFEQPVMKIQRRPRVGSESGLDQGCPLSWLHFSTHLLTAIEAVNARALCWYGVCGLCTWLYFPLSWGP